MSRARYLLDILEEIEMSSAQQAAQAKMQDVIAKKRAPKERAPRASKDDKPEQSVDKVVHANPDQHKKDNPEKENKSNSSATPTMDRK